MTLVGMYEGDPYGDEVDGGEDRNDGLNALVLFKNYFLNNDYRTCNTLSGSTRTSTRACTTSLPMRDT